MVADLAFDTLQARDKDTDATKVFQNTESISNLVNMAARGLVEYHTEQTPVDITSWGSPSIVFEEITKKLEPFHGRALAEEMAAELVDNAQYHASQFQSRHNANRIAVKLVVNNRNPEGQFETGPKQVVRYDVKSKSVDIIGSSNIEVRLTASGTVITSNRADVDAMFAGAVPQSLFAVYEAPDKSELEEMANDAAMAVLANITDGGLSPEELEGLLELLQKMGAEGLITPELMAVIENMQQIATLSEAGMTPEVQKLIQETVDQIAEGIEEGTIPEALADFSIETLIAIVPHNDLQAILANRVEPEEVSIASEVEALTEKLNELLAMDDLDADMVAALRDQIEKLESLESLEGVELRTSLDEIKASLIEMAALSDLPDAAYAKISEILLDVGDVSQKAEVSNTSLLDSLPELAGMGAEELLEVLQELSELDNPPAAIQEILDQLNIEAITPEILARAIEAGAETELGSLVQDLVVALSTPEVQLALPQETLNSVSTFLESHSDLVEAVALKSVVQNLETALDGIEADSPEAQKITEIIEQLKEGETTLAELDTDVIAAIAGHLDGAALDAVQNSVDNIRQIVEAVKSDNIHLASETLEAIENVLDDPDLSEEAREKLETALQSGDEALIVATIADTPEILRALPAEIHASVEKAVEIAQSAQAAAEAAPVEISADVKQDVAEALDKADVSESVKQEIMDALEAGDAAQVLELIKENPAVMAAMPETVVAEVNRIAEAVAEAAPVEISADVKQDMTAALDKADVSEAVKQEIMDALEAGDAAQVLELIKETPAVMAAMPETVVTEVNRIAEAVAEAAPVEISADVKQDVTAALDKADVSEAVKQEIMDALEAGDAAQVLELIKETPAVMAAMPETVVTEVNRIAEAVAEAAPVEISADVKQDMTAALDKADVSESVKQEIMEALEAGDAAQVLELIKETPAVMAAMPETVVTEVNRIAEAVAEAAPVEISADVKQDMTAALDKADVSESVKQEIMEALEAGDAAQVLELIKETPAVMAAMPETVVTEVNRIAEAVAEAAPVEISADVKQDMTVALDKADVSESVKQEIMEALEAGDAAQVLELIKETPAVMAAMPETVVTEVNRIAEAVAEAAPVEISADVKQDMTAALDKADVSESVKQEIMEALEAGDAAQVLELIKETPAVMAAMPETVVTEVNRIAEAVAEAAPVEISADVKQDMTAALDKADVSESVKQEIMEALEAGDAAQVLELIKETPAVMAAMPETVVTEVNRIAEAVAEAAPVEISADVKQDMTAALDKADVSESVKQEIMEALEAGDAAQVLELIKETPAVMAAMPETVVTEVNRIAEAVAEAAPVEISADVKQDMTVALDKADVSESVKQEIMEALEAGDAAQVLELIKETPAVMAAMPETVVTEVNRIAEAVAEAAPVEISADVKQDMTAALDKADVSESVKQEIMEALEAGDAAQVLELIKETPAVMAAMPETVVQETNNSLLLSQDHNVIEPLVDQVTMDNLEAITLMESYDEQVREVVQHYLDNPDNQDALREVHQKLGENSPPQIVQFYEAHNDSNHIAIQEKPSIPASLVDTPREVVSPDAQPHDSLDIKEKPKFEKSCGAGGCPAGCSCGFKDAASEGAYARAEAVVASTAGLADFSLTESVQQPSVPPPAGPAETPSIPEVFKASPPPSTDVPREVVSPDAQPHDSLDIKEKPKFEKSCGAGGCPAGCSCGFKDAASEGAYARAEAVVASTAGLADFSLTESVQQPSVPPPAGPAETPSIPEVFKASPPPSTDVPREVVSPDAQPHDSLDIKEKPKFEKSCGAGGCPAGCSCGFKDAASEGAYARAEAVVASTAGLADFSLTESVQQPSVPPPAGPAETPSIPEVFKASPPPSTDVPREVVSPDAQPHDSLDIKEKPKFEKSCGAGGCPAGCSCGFKDAASEGAYARAEAVVASTAGLADFSLTESAESLDDLRDSTKGTSKTTTKGNFLSSFMPRAA